ncbi:MAG: aldolase/citrate lyase family protein [Kiritimatiellae bacterium]|nr:aldolase/citrate lyase family protein [Kiritimatiellia bacterium]
MKCNNLEKFLAKVQGGEVALGGCVSLADPAVTEIVAASGFDFVFIDGEHGEIDRFTAMQHLMAVKGTDCASFYRVPSCNHTEIKKVIDFCPAGVIVPMVMNAEEAELAVAAMRYPPRGNRGCGFRRGLDYGAGDFDAYWKASEHDPMTILQLEHVDAVRDLDRILEVPGLDSVLIGPYDLSASMGKPGRWNDPEVKSVYDESCRKILAAGKLLGVSLECEYAAWKARGVHYMAVRGDCGAMIEGFRKSIEAFKNA